MLIYVPLLGFIMGSCWLLITFVKDITNDLSFLKADEINSRNDMELKEIFCKTVKFYSTVKGLSNNEKRLVNYILAAILTSLNI